MKCPHDQTHLKLMANSASLSHRCPSCFGFFLSGKAVQAFKHNHESDILDLLATTAPQAESATICPSCTQSMELKHIDDIELDCCTHCGGIWFDPTELENLVDRHGHSPRNHNETIASALLDFLGALIPF